MFQMFLKLFNFKINLIKFYYIFPDSKPSLGIDSATFLIENTNSDKNYKEIRVNQEAYNINMHMSVN